MRSGELRGATALVHVCVYTNVCMHVCVSMWVCGLKDFFATRVTTGTTTEDTAGACSYLGPRCSCRLLVHAAHVGHVSVWRVTKPSPGAACPLSTSSVSPLGIWRVAPGVVLTYRILGRRGGELETSAVVGSGAAVSAVTVQYSGSATVMGGWSPA